jgi:rubredoxin
MRKCPNCGSKSLKFILNEWVCFECEFHSKELNKRIKGSFR